MKTEVVLPVAPVCSPRVTLLLQGAFVAILYALLYARLVSGLVDDWYTFSTYSYGFLVPLIAGYLAWKKRERLKTLPLAPTYWGVVTLLFVLLLFLTGQVINDTFVMRVSMVFAMVALIQTMLGNRFLKELGFSIFYLTLMIPVPYVLVKAIVHYLMFFDAKYTAAILPIFGIPIYLDSNFLHLPQITLEVADACSGIQSVFALFVLGIFYAHLQPLSVRLKMLLVASAVPLAVIANLFRIMVTVGLTYYVGPIVLGSLFHKLYGTFNFVISFMLLIGLAELLRRKSALAQVRPASVNYRPAVASGTSPGKSWNTTALSAIVIAMTMWLSAVLEKPSIASRPVNLVDLPSSVALSTAAPPWPDAYRDSKAKQSATRFYESAAGIPIELFLGYRGGSTDGERLQSPKLVLPGEWSYLWVEPTQLDLGKSERIEANWMLTRTDRNRRLVLYWYEYRGGTFSGELYYRLALFKERLMNRPGAIIVVRIATPLREDENLESARRRLKDVAVVAHRESRRLLVER